MTHNRSLSPGQESKEGGLTSDVAHPECLASSCEAGNSQQRRGETHLGHKLKDCGVSKGDRESFVGVADGGGTEKMACRRETAVPSPSTSEAGRMREEIDGRR